MNEFRPVAEETRYEGLIARGVRLVREPGPVNTTWREVRSWPFLAVMSAVLVGSLLYYFVLAAPLYQSDVRFAIRGRTASAASPLLAAMTGGGGGGISDSPALQDYIRSEDMLHKLDGTVHLRQHYTAFRPDPFYHLDRNAPNRRFLSFYNHLVKVDLDSTNNLMTLHVYAFDAASAQNIARAILNISSAFIDTLGRQAEEEATRAAQRDYQAAQAQAIKARLALNAFQAKSGNLDPTAIGTAGTASIFSLQATIATLRAQLASTLTYSTRNAPAVTQIQAQIANLQQQVNEQKQKLVGQQNSGAVVNQLNSYQGLLLQQTYAQQRVTAVQTALDVAMSAAQQRQEFVVPIYGPNRPDTPSPRTFKGILTIMLGAAFLYAIARLGIASIRDHIV